MMKPTSILPACLAAFANVAAAHEGHGTPGSFGHDLQHQLWTFAALVAVGALLLAGERVVATLRVLVRRKRREAGTDSSATE